MYYMLFCVIAIFLICIAFGGWRGIFKSLFALLAMVLSIGITYVANPYVSKAIVDYTEFDEAIEDNIYSRLESTVNKEVTEKLESIGITEEAGLEDMATTQTSEIMGQNPDKATQMQLISGLGIPGKLKDSLVENNNDDIYRQLGIDNFYKYIAKYVTYMIINAIAFILCFIVLRLILMIEVILLNNAVAETPVLAGINRIGGMMCGAVVGIVIVWIFMAVVQLIFGADYDTMIAQNVFLTKLDSANLLVYVVTRVVEVLSI